MPATPSPRSLVALSDTPLFLFPPAALSLAEAVPRSDWTSGTGSEGDPARGYTVDNGIATIPVRGALANRKEDASWFFGETSYEDLRGTIDAALIDPECKAILLDVDSPGGAAAGAMETSAFIRSASSRKPIVAFVDGMACSAAYALACGAQDIIAAPSATLGSIGVVMLHWDMSKFLDDMGLKPTLLHSGAYKTDGFPTKPLESDAAARIQRTLDVHYAHFLSTVGLHRPMMGEKGARKTEAGVFVGPQTLSVGFADALGDRTAARAVAFSRISAAATVAGGGPRLAGRSGAVFLSIRTETMAVHLYGPGRSHANSLIEDGKVDKDSSWGFSAEDGDKLLGADGDDWKTYASFHLAEDDSETDKTKARYKYPFGKDGKAYRSGVIAAKSRAAQQSEKAIEDAAAHLLEKIDGKSEEESRMVDQNALAAAREEGRVHGVSEGVKEGVKSERARIGAILNHDEAKARIGTALVFALDTDMSADIAVKALAATPAAAAVVTTTTHRLDANANSLRLTLAADAPDTRQAGSDYDRGAAEMAAAMGKKRA